MARDLPARRNGAKTVRNGRDAHGRFLPGNPGGGRPANPFGRYQTELRGALLAEVHPTDVRAIARKVLQLAKGGNLLAAELALKWTLGGPAPVVDPDRLEEHELEVRQHRPTLVDWVALSDEQADRHPAAEVEADPDAAAAEADAPDPREPSLRTTLRWAIEELAQAQYALRLQRPPPDPAKGWEAFAASRVEFAPQAAVELDQLRVSYLQWCAGHGEVPLEEGKVMPWLQDHGATVRTAPLSQTALVVGVRITA